MTDPGFMKFYGNYVTEANPDTVGVVYFVRSMHGDGPIKIGMSRRHSLSRLADLQSGSPLPLQIVGTLRGGRRHELALHAQFANVRQHGEWFTYHPDMDEYIGVFCKECAPPPFHAAAYNEVLAYFENAKESEA